MTLHIIDWEYIVGEPGPSRRGEEGQILIALALILPVLVLFAGLSIDIAFGYVTKAKLSKAVDAACLTGMRNLAQGQDAATALAMNAFHANYGSDGLDRTPPAVEIAFTTNASGNVVINVSATSNIRTFFMGYLPQWSTLTVAATAQGSRSKLIMSLVLDRSGSMGSNGGSTALPPAVTAFVNYFDNQNDELAMVSFASNATADVPINYQFSTPITSAVKTMSFTGATFGVGGLTLGQAQIDSVVVPPGQNITKVVVYFTDGIVNTIQDTFNCTNKWGPTLYNFGGFDPPSNDSHFDFFDPSDGTDWDQKGLGRNAYGLDSNNYPPHYPTPDCAGVTKFISQSTGQATTFSRSNITADAKYRAIQVANAMRAEGMIVYSIGLSSAADQSFLKQIANDPSSPSYDANQPEGLAVFVPNCPSSSCSASLQQVFQTIAAKILLRLTK